MEAIVNEIGPSIILIEKKRKTRKFILEVLLMYKNS